jgi:carboxypeptidase C (cathepsin A)
LAPKPECDAYTAACGTDLKSESCRAAEKALDKAGDGLDAYALDFPTCADSAQTKALDRHLGKKRHHEAPGPYDPCVDDELTTYLNLPEVVQAIHAKKTRNWSMCSSVVDYGSDSDPASMTPTYQYLAEIAPDLHVTVYSGDNDSVCAALGSQIWMYDFNKNQSGPAATPAWKAWQYDDTRFGKQIGGYYVQWPVIDLITVHGAGHMVPTTQPEKGFEVFKSYLSGQVPVVTDHQ